MRYIRKSQSRILAGSQIPPTGFSLSSGSSTWLECVPSRRKILQLLPIDESSLPEYVWRIKISEIREDGACRLAFQSDAGFMQLHLGGAALGWALSDWAWIVSWLSGRLSVTVIALSQDNSMWIDSILMLLEIAIPPNHLITRSQAACSSSFVIEVLNRDNRDQGCDQWWWCISVTLALNRLEV